MVIFFGVERPCARAGCGYQLLHTAYAATHPTFRRSTVKILGTKNFRPRELLNKQGCGSPRSPDIRATYLDRAS